MNRFKFNCPACGQRIEADAIQIGLASTCPQCRANIVIPRPEPKQEEPAAPVPASPVTPAPPPEPPPPPSNPVPEPTPTQTGGDQPAVVQIGSLTPELKLEIATAVREHLTDAAHWLPERTGGAGFTYAGKLEAGEVIPLPVNSPEATQFSLFGAVLREFDHRNVTPIATGRKEFLDQEIPEAIQELRSDEAAEGAEPEAPRPLNHPETLAVLDRLIQRYSREIKASKTAFAARKLLNVRLEDLVGKLELEAPIKPEEVATALYHELEELKERLSKLEKAGRKAKSAAAPTTPLKPE
jgi:hypothetical protein